MEWTSYLETKSLLRAIVVRRSLALIYRYKTPWNINGSMLVGKLPSHISEGTFCFVFEGISPAWYESPGGGGGGGVSTLIAIFLRNLVWFLAYFVRKEYSTFNYLEPF